MWSGPHKRFYSELKIEAKGAGGVSPSLPFGLLSTGEEEIS